MLNLVPYQDLTIDTILKHAETVHKEQSIVSVNTNGDIIRSNYGALGLRVRKLANGLSNLGISGGDCVSTFAWNDINHLECYFAIPSIGAICHTVNPRLHKEQLIYILNDAQSKWIVVDPQFLPILTPIVDQVSSLEGIILLGDKNETQYDLDTQLKVVHFEGLVEESSEDFTWPKLDENTASGCCYTSGTTGNPKGVLYSHRSTVIHSMAAAMGDAIALKSSTNILVVVPMFHVNAWGLPYSAAMMGAKLILPGRFMGDGAKLTELIEQENINIAAGVPTIWQNWVLEMRKQEKQIRHELDIVIGGSACTEQLRSALEALGCHVKPAWGMTETSPVGCINPFGENEHRLSPGKAVYGVELRIINDQGESLPHDGKTTGELQIRGPWIARGYIGKSDSPEFTEDGWFSTGDIAKLYPDGNMHIEDRAKDIIKSGGEWISSTMLEDVATSHPAVASAAVIAKPDPKWDERPVLLVVAQGEAAIDKKALLDWYDGKVASWWRPDDVLVIDNLPLTATGKIDKKQLRSTYVS